MRLRMFRSASLSGSGSISASWASRYQRRAADVVEIGEVMAQIGISTREHRILLAGPDPAAGPLAVPGVQRIGDVHPVDDACERHERLGTERGAFLAPLEEHMR